MAKYQQYDDYKDIQNKWISSVPSDWKVVPLKALCLNPVKDGPHETPIFIDEGIPFLSVDGVQNNQLVFEGCRYISEQDHEKYSRKCVPAKGDVLLGKAASVGKVAYVETEIDFNVWSPLAVITPKTDKLGKYIFYAFQSTMLQAQCDVYSNANTQKNLGMNTIDNLHLPFPSYEEAEVIANFLDFETAQIDTLIEKQQTLIQLLKEKRQAVISHAVTKGLNPDAPMKDSGVEWLGEVPEHWELPKLIHQTSKIGDGLHSTPQYQDGTGYYFVNGNNLVSGQIVVSTTSKEVPEDEYKKHYIYLDNSSVLLSINGTIGNVARYNNEMVILGKSAAYMNCADSLLPEYLMVLLQSSQAHYYFDLEVTGTTIYNLSLNSIRQMRVCIPPKQEQSKIHKFCELQQNKYDTLIEKASTAIRLMQERRTALISAAVTGKIDVRGWRASE